MFLEILAYRGNFQGLILVLVVLNQATENLKPYENIFDSSGWVCGGGVLFFFLNYTCWLHLLS